MKNRVICVMASCLFAAVINAKADTINIPATAATIGSGCSAVDLDTGIVGNIATPDTCQMSFSLPVPLGKTLDKVDVNYQLGGIVQQPQPKIVAAVVTERYLPQQGLLGLSTRQATGNTQAIQALTVPLGFPVWDGETYLVNVTLNSGYVAAISLTYH
jgi:hypothetical protein